MSSGLTIMSSVGRKAARPAGVVYLRDLSEADLPLIQNPPPLARPSGESIIAKLRSTHHNLARLLASGLSQVEVSEITGYTQSRISVLKSDPAFSDLIAYYESQTKEVFVDVSLRLQATGLLALEQIHEALEEEPEKISLSQRLDIVNSTIGPKAKGSFAAPAGGSAPVALNITFTTPQHTEPGITIEGKSE